jgi:uncharacterized membrane protein YjjP (DUF1212 family)
MTLHKLLDNLLNVFLQIAQQQILARSGTKTTVTEDTYQTIVSALDVR